jgi:predicted transcriptional regulator
VSTKKTRTRAPVGKELAKLRIDLDETTGHMAERLGIHAVHLSKVEGGTVAFSSALASKIKDFYGLDLTHMINEAVVDKVTLYLSKLSPEDRATVLAIQARMKGDKKEQSGSVAAPKVVRQPPPAVPDVDGVDFLDDLSSLDELD